MAENEKNEPKGKKPVLPRPDTTLRGLVRNDRTQKSKK